MIPQLVTAVAELLGRIIPDKNAEQRNAFAKEIISLTQEFEMSKSQMKINEAEAANPNRTYVSWRELIGYAGACSIIWHYCLVPIITYFVVMSGHQAPPLPELASADLMNLIYGLLGLGAMRSYEKKANLTVKK